MSLTTIRVQVVDSFHYLVVRCDLTKADSSIEINYGEDFGWALTEYHTADARHNENGLARIGIKLMKEGLEDRNIECEWEVQQ